MKNFELLKEKVFANLASQSDENLKSYIRSFTRSRDPSNFDLGDGYLYVLFYLKHLVLMKDKNVYTLIFEVQQSVFKYTSAEYQWFRFEVNNLLKEANRYVSTFV